MRATTASALAGRRQDRRPRRRQGPVNCGGGKDVAIADKQDQIKRTARRSGARKKGKKKGQGQEVRPARRLAAAAALCAAAAAGCGLGPGRTSGEVELTVTRDYGTEVLERATESINESDTVLRVLDRNADIETRYGGGFVQSIDGLAGGQSGGRRTDWFFYVNGIESPIGSAEYDLSDGDRIWWDHHDWTSAMRVPAVVGSWPEPFLHGFEGERWAADVRLPRRASRLRTPSSSGSGGGCRPSELERTAITVEVGTWERIRSDPTPACSPSPRARAGSSPASRTSARPLLTLLNQRGEPAGSTRPRGRAGRRAPARATGRRPGSSPARTAAGVQARPA